MIRRVALFFEVAILSALILATRCANSKRDKTLWPNESEIARRVQRRADAVQWRNIASSLKSGKETPFLAPWWLSPSASYWSEQPAVAGSSHESLPGIAASARFFLATDPQVAREILNKRRVAWVLVSNADEMMANSAAILGVPVPTDPLGRILARSPSHAPPFLVFSAQNGAVRLFRVNNR